MTTAHASVLLDELTEPEQYRVLLCYGGELVGAGNAILSRRAADLRCAELRARFPRHEIHLVRRTVTWTEENDR